MLGVAKGSVGEGSQELGVVVFGAAVIEGGTRGRGVEREAK